MLCQKCGLNEANFHMVQIINGKRTEQHLCSKCAGDQEKNLFETTFNMNKMFSNFFNPSIGFQPSIQTVQKCSRCGLSFNDFTNGGLFGCPHCYEVFSSRLEEPLKRLQGATTHIGKRIKNENMDSKAEKDILQEQLKRAIAEENYELAAELRDRIKGLEGK